ncbi:uncharacterized protein AMSG_11610 [Thecamonas trahens ATCC 50062]|uniref:Uncharacterized protein n=1 Tax=Thecamonas trahens ATCC 50062 TaxID=461836 RepID=A0A0L0DEB8_THETB|nr:hypothetical protein AMSG_11610 [Thecamonas trahens ATCC 50062]KNC50506.1 hypothetical protein AMSG_11610 [Thecamonas trahens ATCC 50062]|eukprot:XP_013762589.1 hypothetical protein AMSG_11610 [Thecamonas trahens ATCC 50062]
MTSRMPLEAFKFAIYLTVPIGVGYVITHPAMTDTLKGFTSMKNEQEGPRPPTGSLEEVRKWQAMHAGQAPTGSSQA